MIYDLVIHNVRIIDGSSAPWFRGWVGVKDGVITKVGTGRASRDALEIADGEDRCLTPGSSTSMPTAIPACRGALRRRAGFSRA